MNGVKKLFFLHLRFWAIFIGSIAIGVVVGSITTWLACTIAPSVIVEANGEVHYGMPLGQVFLGFLIGLLAAIISLIYLLRINRHHFR